MKKIVRKLLIVLLISISLLSINQIINVKADSGWDSSYSGGGSWNSGSSYGSGSSGSGSIFIYYNDEVLTIFSVLPNTVSLIMTLIAIISLFVSFIIRELSPNSKKLIKFFRNVFLIYLAIAFVGCIFVMIFIGFFIYCFYLFSPYYNKNVKSYNEITEDELKKYINKSLVKTKQELYDKFVKVQEAWMNFDYESLRKLCNDNIYNTYYEELEALKLKDGQNIMSDFIKIEDKIIDVSNNNDLITIDYYLDVEFYDYVINTKTNKIQKGNDKVKIHNIYKLTFTKSTKENNICPNCGAHIESGTTKCSHCKAVIVKDSSEFVLSEKRKIG